MKRQLILFLALASLFTMLVFAQALGNLSGTVKDPNGAFVVGAQVSVRHETTNETRTATTDAQGRFSVTGLAPGNYVISITRDGFKPTEQKVVIEDKRTATTEIKLDLAEVRGEVTTSAVGTIKPNMDPNYRALRDSGMGESYAVSGLTLKRDVGTFTLKTGRISFLPPVLGRVVIGVFVGDGEFTLTPYLAIEKDYLKQVTEKDAVAESFARMVLTFTDGTYEEIKKQAQAASGDEAQAKDVLQDFHNRMRRNTDTPRSLVEYFLTGENVENIEAELLASLYNPKRPGLFNAYIFGSKHKDLRFLLRPLGAFPQLLTPEEVALVNVDPLGKEEGLWYLSHLVSEFENKTASSDEDKRLIDAEQYKIETAIKGEKLTSIAEIKFKALVEGERLFHFSLLPTLRVSRVLFQEKEVHYIQEDRKDDSAFYAILPQALGKGQSYKIVIEYEGKKVLSDQGGGNFSVAARTSWYPSVNAFNDRATFDLTFKIPKKYVLISVGKMVKEWKEEEYAASQWVSEVPLAVAGFNYGSFKKKELRDEPTKYDIEGFATPELPGYLRGAESIGGMVPTRMLDKAINEAQNSMRIFSNWFGELPYGRIAITQQPEFNFGQSWPSLVYLPISAFFDSTQRWRLLGGISKGFNDFIQEVTPHEVAHQWWGHIVGWASYHDQWLSEGFADFSASLFLQYTEPKLDKYLDFWKTNHRAITEKNEFGKRPNEAGPLWMGIRLNSFKNEGAYRRLVYPKGGYVLHMLRWMMYDRQTGDQKFMVMMRDFVKLHYNENASTEGFKFVVEKHMLPRMDLEGNKRMDWFFRQYVYGTELPSYKFEYTLTGGEGECELKGKLTQSGVSEHFKMPVPLYLDYDGKFVRVGEIHATGNKTTPEFTVKLPKRPKRVLINAYYDVLALESTSIGK